MVSIWSKTSALSPRPALEGELRVPAAVVGGGMAGILAAYLLEKRGIHTVVLEASAVGSGQTKNSTAKITSQHGLIYDRLIREFGEEHARQYAEANEKAIWEYRRIVCEENIACDFHDCEACLYTREDPEALAREARAAQRLGIAARLEERTELPLPARAALYYPRQARFHPLKFIDALAGKLEVYENTRVISVEGNRLCAENGTVTADRIVFATHYPQLNAPGYYFMRMHQERSYCLALEDATDIDNIYYGIDPDGLSVRPGLGAGALILSGGSHRTGENSAGGRYEQLRRAARAYWPQSRETAAWSAQDCMTLDGVPYIGRFSLSTPGWYVATGFQKWGISSSMAAALILCDLLAGREHPYAVFSPQRFKLSASARTLFEETAEASKGLSREIFAPPRAVLAELPNGHGGVVEVDGRKAGVYKDERGETFIVSVRCPHLGCQLEWNPDEKSWDCPCHGSRFDYRGNLLDNPAQVGIRLEPRP